MNVDKAKRRLASQIADNPAGPPPTVSLILAAPLTARGRQRDIAYLATYMEKTWGYRLDAISGLPGQTLVFKRIDN
jgi:hypothetical protein